MQEQGTTELKPRILAKEMHQLLVTNIWLPVFCSTITKVKIVFLCLHHYL